MKKLPEVLSYRFERCHGFDDFVRDALANVLSASDCFLIEISEAAALEENATDMAKTIAEKLIRFIFEGLTSSDH